MSVESQAVVQTIVSELSELPDEKIAEVLGFVRFLRVRYSITAKRHALRNINAERLAQLYAESAEEDVQLAEAGIKEYSEELAREDTRGER